MIRKQRMVKPTSGRYVELARSVKKKCLRKRNYEVRVANEAGSDPYGFIKM